MLSQVLFFLSSLVLLSLRVHGFWSTTMVSPDRAFTEKELNPISNYDGVRIRFTSSDGYFNDQLNSDRSIFLGGCTSNVPQNPYGFDYWNSRGAFNPTVRVQGEGNVIEVSMQSVFGFSLLQSETITCNVGNTYLIQGTLESTSVSFTISSRQDVEVRLLTWSDPPGVLPSPIYWADRPQNGAVQFSEISLRSNGLLIFIMMFNDAWSPTKSLLSVSNFTCTTVDENACNTLGQLLSDPQYISIDRVRSPHVVVVNVSRAVMRTFNTKRNVQLSLGIADGVASFGYKNVPLTSFSINTIFTISAYAKVVPELFIATWNRGEATYVPGTLGQQSLDLSENCIRGRNQSSACAMAYWLFMPYFADAQNEFVPSRAACLKDFSEIGFYSEQMQRYFPSSSLQYLSSRSATSGGGTVEINLLAYTNAFVGYQIDTVDVVRLAVPFSCLTTLEPPASYVRLNIYPSPGDIVGSCPNIPQSILWSGGHVAKVHLGGERWKDEILESFLNYTFGSRGVDGWMAWRTCVLPYGSLSFDNSTGVVNRSVLVLNFQPCPQYVVGGNETITFVFPADVGVSGLGFARMEGLSFDIAMTPGTYALEGNLSYTQDTLPFASYVIQLQGGATFLPTATPSCISAIRDLVITTNRPQTTRNPTGWGNATVRARLLPTVVSLTDRVGTYSRLQLVFDRSFKEYRTTTGENLTFTTIPLACLASDTPVPPSKTYLVRVTPRMGNVTLTVRAPNGAETRNLALSAGFIRSGNFSLVFRVANDTFNDENPSLLQQVINASLTTDSPQPFGFRNLKQSLLSRIEILSSTEVSVYFTPNVLLFAITANETVTIRISSAWMSSLQDTTTFTITIYPSPGTVLLDDWYGSSRNVTEEDVRTGRLWFRFAMIGDQWRQERSPFVAMFSGGGGAATGFLALIDALVPSIEFFNFTSSSTYQYLTLTLQSSDEYDIAAGESVRIAFSSAATSSGLPPSFGTADGTFTFRVLATSGRVVLSGQRSLTEKILREGGAQLFVTLFGETWGPNAPSCVRQGIRIITNEARDTLLNSTILPSEGASIRQLGSRLLVITFLAARSYVLGGNLTDVLVLDVSGRCSASGHAPIGHRSELRIAATRGELVLSRTIPSVVTEATLRTSQLTVQITLDGTIWSAYTLRNLDALLLTGFSSSREPALQPRGFMALKHEILGLNVEPDVGLTLQSMTVRFAITPEYDIDEDEVISFTLTDSQFVSEGLLPSPARVEFRVAALPDELATLYRPGGGQLDLLSLRSRIANFLSINHADESAVTVRQVGRQGTSFIVYVAIRVTPSLEDPRTTAELLRGFMSYNLDYLSDALGISCVKLVSTLGSDGVVDCSQTVSVNTTSHLVDDVDLETIGIWLGVSLGMLTIVTVIVIVTYYYQGTTLQGSVRARMVRKQATARTIRYEGAGPDDAYVSVRSRMVAPVSLRSYAEEHRKRMPTDMAAENAAAVDGEQPEDLQKWADAAALQRRQERFAKDAQYRKKVESAVHAYA